MAANTIRELVNLGFDEEKAQEAVVAIGDASDTQTAINWLLDNGEDDKGGTVVFKHCPHVDELGYEALIKRTDLKFDNRCLHGCNGSENWVSLHDGKTRCGRYAFKHSKAHWEETKKQQESTITVADAARGRQAYGHCLVIGLSDLSTWCYECQAYVQHESLVPLIKQLEKIKFGESSSSTDDAASSGHSTVPNPQECSSDGKLRVDAVAMHGRLGDTSWAAPELARECSEEARPGYKTKKAHEYLDVPHVLEAKVKMLASMIQKSKNCVAYTGAGISTASGISDYATKASGSIATANVEKVSHWAAKPTFAHRALVALHKLGPLKHWVQQNHDGLPQKAGFPQQHINEIHGAWYDPSNPVVPMSGTLRGDLIEWMLEWEEKADLCLALGSSMVGMNSDRMATTPAQKAKHGKAIGTVIVALQQTQYDAASSLRIFAPIDQVMELLSKEMGFKVAQSLETPTTAKQHQADVYTDLPYSADGKLSKGSKLTLDLRPGSRVRIINQQDWDKESWGDIGVVLEPQDSLTEECHYAIRLGKNGVVRVLGKWWLDAAAEGLVPSLPVAPAPAPAPAGYM